MSKEIKKDLSDDEQQTKIYPVLETTIPIPSTIPSAPNGVPQAAVRYINHSRNASSVSRNSRNAVTFAVPPPNKPDAVDSLLKIIGLRSNYEKSKEKKICFVRITILLSLFIVLLFSGSVFYVMWFTEWYNNSIIANLVYAENSTALKYFIKPPLDPLLRVHIFNYTNADRFLDGTDDKLIVEDIGPFTYTEKVEKVNVVYNDNDTISYREHRSFIFQPNLSEGKQYAQVTVPNIPMLTAAAKMKYASFLQNIGINFALSKTNSHPFKTVSADSFLWGYPDELVDLSKTLAAFSEPLPFEKFGMLVTRNGTSRETFTVNSGVDDLRKLGLIDNFNGAPSMDFWATDECNRVDGTDGSQFPPHLMDKKQALQVFVKAFCRKFPLVYDSEVNIFDGVPAWRYKGPRDVFNHPSITKENQCFCHVESGKCAPSGVFNATLCFGSPIYSSYPHFLFGEKSLFSKIDGLKPDENLHLSYADIHPRLAFPMTGASRFQINVQVNKIGSISDLQHFDDEQILPVMWMEVTSDEIPEEFRAMIYHSTFSANAIQLSLRYGSLLIVTITLAVLVAGYYYNAKTEEEKEAAATAAATITSAATARTKYDEGFEEIDLNGHKSDGHVEHK